MEFVLAESDPPRRRVSRIVGEKLKFGGQWEFTLMPSGGGTELTIIERGFVEPPIFRFLSRYFFGYSTHIVAYELALGRKLGRTAAPEVIASAGRN
jgi:hypothetical protein